VEYIYILQDSLFSFDRVIRQQHTLVLVLLLLLSLLLLLVVVLVLVLVAVVVLLLLVVVVVLLLLLLLLLLRSKRSPVLNMCLIQLHISLFRVKLKPSNNLYNYLS